MGLLDDDPEVEVEREKYRAERAKQTANGSDAEERRFKPVRFRDIEFDPTATDYVRDLIPSDSLVVGWGPPKCGKSFFFYDLCMHIARGEPYRGRPVLSGVVCYVACEGSRGLRARTEAYRQTLPPDADPPFFLLTTRLDLVADVETLAFDIRRTPGAALCNVFVVDTLNRSLAGSENKPEDMTAYISAADRLREAFPGSTVILIHHCGVDGNRPRGFTGLTAAADGQIAVKRDAAGNIVATVEMMKDRETGEPIISKLRPVTIGYDQNNTPITSCIVEPATAALNARTKPQARLSAKEQIALDTLQKALAAEGKSAPTHNHIPPSATVIPVDLWRRCYLAGTSADGQPEDTRRKAWRRSCEALMAKHIIGLCDEMVWKI